MSRYRWEIVVSLCLAAAVLSAFGHACANGFVDLDDGLYVTRNAGLRSGLSVRGISWAFITLLTGNWHPLTWLSLLLDYQLYGLSPWGYHLTNILLHTANVVLLFWAFRFMTGQLWPSATLAALFALHPLRVESVAWVSERKDVLSSFFGILSILAYAWYARCPSWKRYTLVVGFFALSLLAKPMLVTLPFVFLLLDYWPLKRGKADLLVNFFHFPFSIFHSTQMENEKWKMKKDRSPPRPSPLAPLLLEKVPLIVIALAASLVTLHAQAQAMSSLQRFPFHLRVENAIVSYLDYIRMTLAPVGLAVFYPHPGSELSIVRVAIALFLLACISVAAAFSVRRAPYFPVGWLWFLGMLVPVIGIVQVGVQGLADRYTYLPSVGLFVVLVWGSLDLANRWGWQKLLAPVAVAWIAILGILTWISVGYWHDTGSLWEHAVAVTTGNARAHFELGSVYFGEGQFAKAEKQFRAALDIPPASPTTAAAHADLGFLLYHTGRPEEGERHYDAALMILPRDAAIHFGLALCLSLTKRFREAETHYQSAVEIEPENIAFYAALGDLYHAMGRLDDAQRQYRIGLEIAPDDEGCHNKLGYVLLTLHRPAEAVEHFQLAARRNPRSVVAYLGLGTALTRQGRFDDAIAYLRRAIDLEPEQAGLHTSLAFALALHGELGASEKEYRIALSQPSGASGVATDAWILATQSDPHFRNGEMALRLARILCQGPGRDDPAIMDLHAAALAEQGQYAAAAALARQARELAMAKRPNLVKPLELRLQKYENHQPYHEDPKAKAQALKPTP